MLSPNIRLARACHRLRGWDMGTGHCWCSTSGTSNKKLLLVGIKYVCWTGAGSESCPQQMRAAYLFSLLASHSLVTLEALWSLGKGAQWVLGRHPPPPTPARPRPTSPLWPPAQSHPCADSWGAAETPKLSARSSPCHHPPKAP